MKWAVYALIAAGLFLFGWMLGSDHVESDWQKKWDQRTAAEAAAVHSRDIAAVPVITHEAVQLAKDTSAPITDAPTILVCPDPAKKRRAVQPAAPARPVDNGRPELPGGDEGGAPHVCSTEPVLKPAHDADAQIKQLKDYINHVTQQ